MSEGGSEDDAPGPNPDARGSDTAASLEGRAAWIAALVAVFLAAAFMAGPHDFPLDDAWIHLSYAKSLRLGDGASYNPGDHEPGFSSPLWMVLLAVWPIAGDPVRPVQLLGLLLHGLTAWLAAHLGLRLARQRATDARPLPLLSLTLLAGVLAAATPTLVQASASGMEVSLTAALLLAVAWAALFGHVRAAAAMGMLAVWARPEALGFVVALAAIVVPWHWRAGRRGPQLRAPLAAIAGATVALGTWMIYCRVVADQWWPSAQYVKGRGGGLAGLSYLGEQVLPWQPWLVSLTGVLLLGLALRDDLRERRPELLALVGAGTATLVAIALSRPLDPAVSFYQSRYFAPLAAIFVVVLPLGLPRRRRWGALALVLPIAVVSGLQLRTLHQRSQAQRADTHLLHGALAQHLVEQLPADARVAVEGAGAPRFFAPRSMTIIDLVGLNDHVLARLGDDAEAKMCRVVARRPTHFAIPAEWIDTFRPVFSLRAIARFHDPVYTQVEPPRPLTVVLLAVDEIHPAWRAGCPAPDPPAASP